MTAISAVYRKTRSADWKDCEIVDQHKTGDLILREVDKFYRGVWLAGRDQVRISGPKFMPETRS